MKRFVGRMSYSRATPELEVRDGLVSQGGEIECCTDSAYFYRQLHDLHEGKFSCSMLELRYASHDVRDVRLWTELSDCGSEKLKTEAAHQR